MKEYIDFNSRLREIYQEAEQETIRLILESFSIVGEYEISFVHLGIVMGFISMYKDEVEECENLTEEDADYIIDIDGIKFYIFNI